MSAESFSISDVTNPRQQQLLELLEARPSLNIKEIAEALGVRRTAAKHHVRKLARKNLVVTVRQGRHVFHFLTSMSPQRRLALSLLRIASIRALVQTAFENPNWNWDQLAHHLSVSTRTIRRAIRILERNGLLHVNRNPDSAINVINLSSELRLILVRWVAPSDATPKPPPVLKESLWLVGWAFGVADSVWGT